jgi:hypothetical protein
MNKIVIYILILISALFAYSCVELENTVSFNKDGSGTILLKYRISKMILDNSDLDIPLPLTTKEFRFAVENQPGISIKQIVQEENETDMIITAEFDFASIETLLSVYELSSMQFSLTIDSATRDDYKQEFVFKQTIFEGTGQDAEEINPETMQMLKSFFEGYNLNFTVITPEPVEFNNIGEKINDNTVSFSIPTLELSNAEEEMVFIVKWLQ